MPPLKEYNFRNIEDNGFTIALFAYSKNGALKILTKYVTDPSKYKLC